MTWLFSSNVYTLQTNTTEIGLDGLRTDTNIPSSARITPTTIGTGADRRRIYEIPSNRHVVIAGTLYQDTDYDEFAINHGVVLNGTASFQILGNYFLGIKYNSARTDFMKDAMNVPNEFSRGVGITFGSQPAPEWSQSGTTTPVRANGTSLIVRSTATLPGNFQFLGGIIQGSFTVSYLGGALEASGQISGTATMNKVENGASSAQGFLTRIYSVDIDIQGLTEIGGTISYGQGTRGGIYSINRQGSKIGYINQCLSSIPIVIRDFEVSGNTIDFGLFDNGSTRPNPFTTFLINSHTGTALDIRGTEAGVNPDSTPGMMRSGDSRNGGYCVIAKEISITATKPDGSPLDAVCVVRDTDNGGRKRIYHGFSDAFGNRLGERDDRATTRYRATIRGGSSTTPNSITTWEVTAESTDATTQDSWGARHVRRNNFNNNNAEPSTWTGDLPRIVTGIVNVVDPGVTPTGVDDSILNRNEQGTSGSTSSAGVYRKDLRGKTNVEGEDLFDFHLFSFEANYVTIERRLALTGRLDIIYAGVLDILLTDSNTTSVSGYDDIESTVQAYDWFKYELFTNYDGEDEVWMTRVGMTSDFNGRDVYFATRYDVTVSYVSQDIVYHQNRFQRANKTTTGTFKDADWDNVTTSNTGDRIGVVTGASVGGSVYLFYGNTTQKPNFLGNVVTSGTFWIKDEERVTGTISDSTGVRVSINMPNGSFYKGTYGIGNVAIPYPTSGSTGGGVRLTMPANTDIRIAIKTEGNSARYFTFNAGLNGLNITPEYLAIPGAINTYTWLTRTNIDLEWKPNQPGADDDELSLTFDNVNLLPNLWVSETSTIVNFVQSDENYLDAMLARADQGFFETNDLNQLELRDLNVEFKLANTVSQHYQLQAGIVQGANVEITTPVNSMNRQVVLVNLINVANNLTVQGGTVGSVAEKLDTMLSSVGATRRWQFTSESVALTGAEKVVYLDPSLMDNGDGITAPLNSISALRTLASQIRIGKVIMLSNTQMDTNIEMVGYPLTFVGLNKNIELDFNTRNVDNYTFINLTMTQPLGGNGTIHSINCVAEGVIDLNGFHEDLSVEGSFSPKDQCDMRIHGLRNHRIDQTGRVRPIEIDFDRVNSTSERTRLRITDAEGLIELVDMGYHNDANVDPDLRLEISGLLTTVNLGSNTRHGDLTVTSLVTMTGNLTGGVTITRNDEIGRMGDRFINMTQADGTDFRFTTNALEQAPTGTGSGGGGGGITESQFHMWLASAPLVTRNSYKADVSNAGISESQFHTYLSSANSTIKDSYKADVSGAGISQTEFHTYMSTLNPNVKATYRADVTDVRVNQANFHTNLNTASSTIKDSYKATVPDFMGISESNFHDYLRSADQDIKDTYKAESGPNIDTFLSTDISSYNVGGTWGNSLRVIEQHADRDNISLYFDSQATSNGSGFNVRNPINTIGNDSTVGSLIHTLLFNPNIDQLYIRHHLNLYGSNPNQPFPYISQIEPLIKGLRIIGLGSQASIHFGNSTTGIDVDELTLYNLTLQGRVGGAGNFRSFDCTFRSLRNVNGTHDNVDTLGAFYPADRCRLRIHGIRNGNPDTASRMTVNLSGCTSLDTNPSTGVRHYISITDIRGELYVSNMTANNIYLDLIGGDGIANIQSSADQGSIEIISDHRPVIQTGATATVILHDTVDEIFEHDFTGVVDDTVGSVLMRLNEMIQADGSDFRFTMNALEHGPTGASVMGGLTTQQAEDLLEILRRVRKTSFIQ